MPLPDEYIGASVQDLRMRIQHSIIQYNGYPVYVLSVNRKAPQRIDIELFNHRSEVCCVSVNDKRLSVHNIPERFGLMSLDTLGLVRFGRVPRRMFKQGVDLNNTCLGLIEKGNKFWALNDMEKQVYATLLKEARLNHPDRKHYYNLAANNVAQQYGIHSTLPYLITQPGFLEMWHGSYPTLSSVLAKPQGLYAVSRKYYVDTHKTPTFHSRRKHIGDIVHGKIVLQDKKKFLEDELKRTIRM